MNDSDAYIHFPYVLTVRCSFATIMAESSSASRIFGHISTLKSFSEESIYVSPSLPQHCKRNIYYHFNQYSPDVAYSTRLPLSLLSIKMPFECIITSRSICAPFLNAVTSSLELVSPQLVVQEMLSAEWKLTGSRCSASRGFDSHTNHHNSLRAACQAGSAGEIAVFTTARPAVNGLSSSVIYRRQLIGDV